MSTRRRELDDLEQPDADDVKGGVGARVRVNDRTVAAADATAEGVSVTAGDTSASVGAGLENEDGETTLHVRTDD